MDLDPARLIHLRRIRDTRYAALRALTTEARDAAARRAVESRKLIELRNELDRAFPATRRGDLEPRVQEQAARVAAAEAAMTEAQAAEAAATEGWNSCAALFERCLRHAQVQGVTLPPAIIDGPDPTASVAIHGEIK